MTSLTCSLGSVAARRAGMMNDGLAEGLPSASSTRPNGVSSSITNVFLSVGAIFDSEAIISRPTASLAPQRLSEATQSAGHRRAVVELEPVAQGERVLHARPC